MASKLYGVNATIIIFVFVLFCIVLYCIVLYSQFSICLVLSSQFILLITLSFLPHFSNHLLFQLSFIAHFLHSFFHHFQLTIIFFSTHLFFLNHLQPTILSTTSSNSPKGSAFPVLESGMVKTATMVCPCFSNNL